MRCAGRMAERKTCKSVSCVHPIALLGTAHTASSKHREERKNSAGLFLFSTLYNFVIRYRISSSSPRTMGRKSERWREKNPEERESIRKSCRTKLRTAFRIRREKFAAQITRTETGNWSEHELHANT